MIIDAATGLRPTAERHLRWLDAGTVQIGWKGHLYLPDCRAGEESIARLAGMLQDRDLCEIADLLSGVFGLLVFDAARDRWQITGDGAGLYKIFHDRRGAATSYLELVADRRIGPDGVDPRAAMTFLALGTTLAEDTFVGGIRKLQGDEVLSLSREHGLEIQKKRPAAAGAPAAEEVERQFAQTAQSLAGRRLSVDLTGGLDSRLVACLLREQGLAFETAVTGPTQSLDVIVAKRVASLLGTPLHVTGHALKSLEQDLFDVFMAGDGLTDVRRYHLSRQLALARMARGIEVIAHGGGGEAFRDQHFIQDFPFYGSRRSDIGRYMALRLEPARVPRRYLTDRAWDSLVEARTHALVRLTRHRAPTNDETYNRIYYLEKVPDFNGQIYANYINQGLDVVAPLLNPHLAHVAFAMSPWRRFFHGWHRAMLGRVRPDIAELATAEGFTASPRLGRKLLDLRAFAGTQLGRIGRKLGQRAIGRSLVHNVGAFAAYGDGFHARLRASAEFSGALESLKRAGLLRAALVPAAVLDAHLGRMLTLGLLLQYLDGRRPQSPVRSPPH